MRKEGWHCSLDFLEDRGVLSNTHTQQLLRSPVLIENVVSVFPELLHVSANEHLPQLDKVAMIFIVHLHNAPGVRTTTDLATIGGSHKPIRANDSERNFASDFFCFRDGLFILVVVCGGLENVDVVEGNVRKYLVPNE